jgi:hypothetical protein
MPSRIVMVTGDKFDIDMDVDRAASDILLGAARHARLEVPGEDGPRRVYIIRDHIAYAEALEETEPGRAS